MPGDVVDALRSERTWINYNPGPPFDFLAGRHPVTGAQLERELGLLHEVGFRGLVTNTMAFGLERAPEIAKAVGFDHVVAKLWWQDDELLAREQANLDAVLGAVADAVDAVCVGNEIVQKGIADIDRLTREVDGARERYGKPTTTGFQPPDWQLHPELATSIGDFSFLNLHGWWVLHRNDPVAAAGWVAEAYGVVAGAPGMPDDRLVVVQESSFPSGALPPESAPGATPQNQRRFYEALVASGVPFVWFLSVDSPMHRKASPPGGFGGLWDENWDPKPAVEVVRSTLSR
jgi:exo-beta-1,3-glucanase (GH17 family)